MSKQQQSEAQPRPKASPPTDAAMLHEAEGLRIWRNADNGFTVVQLHHTADPAKRTVEWRRDAERGLTKAQAAQELDINYEAMFGERVWPQFGDFRSKIVVPEGEYPEVPAGIRCWGGFDFGTHNPSSFHVYTHIGGVFYSIWELFEPITSLKDFTQQLRDCPYWPQVRWVAADQVLWEKDQHKESGAIISIYDILCQEKVGHKLIRGSRNEAAFITMMHDMWRDLDAQPPGFRIFARCPNQAREFENSIYVNVSDRVLQGRNFTERIVDKDNHSIDDARYFFMSQPNVQTVRVQHKNMARWYYR